MFLVVVIFVVVGLVVGVEIGMVVVKVGMVGNEGEYVTDGE